MIPIGLRAFRSSIKAYYLILFFLLSSLSAQETIPAPGSMIFRSPPPEGAKTHSVALGERFGKGGLYAW